MKRRRFLSVVAAGAASAALPRFAGTEAWMDSGTEPTSASILIHSRSAGRRIPDRYIGLSYELSQLSEPTFFSPEHTDLIALFRRLSPVGILRLGGNTSEFCWFQAEPSTAAPTLHVPPGDLAQYWMPHRLFAIQPDAVRTLAGFLHATGWQAIYGVNFGNSTPERAAIEAAFVARTLGNSLGFFQIGNEPDLYRNPSNGTRPPGWNFDDYIREWNAFADAITAAVPKARFAGPDVAANSDWVVQFGRQMAPRLGERLVALSGHYYAEGPPDDPAVTTARLLADNPKVAESTTSIVEAANAHHLTYHMTEGNSCYRGGKPGMSDAFAASLWSGDYLLLLASLGCAGINLHGGDSRFLSAGLGDHNPGLAVAGEKKQNVPNGFYTPISSERGQPASARPVYYGMLLAQQFAGHAILPIELKTNGKVTAYAAQKDGRQLLAIFNKDEKASFDVSIRSETTMAKAEVWRLAARTLDSVTGITLGGASITNAGKWKPQAEQLPMRQGAARLQITPATGALVFLE